MIPGNGDGDFTDTWLDFKPWHTCHGLFVFHVDRREHHAYHAVPSVIRAAVEVGQAGVMANQSRRWDYFVEPATRILTVDSAAHQPVREWLCLAG